MIKRVKYYIISGRVIEERHTTLSARSCDSFKKRRAPRRAGASSERKIAANEQEAVRRLARLINCNFGRGDIFLTRKYSDKTLPETFEAAEEEMTKTLRKLKAAYKAKTGESLKYIWVPSQTDADTGKPTRFHHHLLFDRTAADLLVTLCEDADEIDMRVLNGKGDYTGIARYIILNGKGGDPNKKRWRSSRNLNKPIFTEPEEIAEITPIEAPAGVEIRENNLQMDEETGIASAYCRFVMVERPRMRGRSFEIPKPKKRGGRRKE